ncbi:unnamed protein product [Toxocara canis]|uniref:Uncharacterized protein n=1 Tax=Toxocara canis TaxID=6265 RepID=A0A3P7FBP0_TOXCA|nr:unnamed protein product [Toxocara canis]
MEADHTKLGRCLRPWLDLWEMVRVAVSVSSNCDLEADHTKLGRCLRPWLDLWEMVRVGEAHATDIVFPVSLFTSYQLPSKIQLVYRS